METTSTSHCFQQGGASLKYAPIAVEHQGHRRGQQLSLYGKRYFLPVPEVNPETILNNTGIIANPNCSTINL